jgi:hypothetical protein
MLKTTCGLFGYWRHDWAWLRDVALRSRQGVRCLVVLVWALGTMACSSQEQAAPTIEHDWSNPLEEVYASRFIHGGAGAVIERAFSPLPGSIEGNYRLTLHRREQDATVQFDLAGCGPSHVTAVANRVAMVFNASSASSLCESLPGTSFRPNTTTANAIAVAMYDAQGAFLWGRNYDVSASSFRPLGIGLDARGTLSMIARRSGELTVDTTSLAEGSGALVLLTFGPEGELQKLRGYDAPLDFDTTLAVDPTTGDRFIAGGFTGLANMGAELLSSGQGAAVLLARLNPEGDPVWVKHFMGRARFNARFGPDGGLVLQGQAKGHTGFFLGGSRVIDGAFVSRLDAAGSHLETMQLAAESPTEGDFGGLREATIERISDGRIVVLRTDAEELAKDLPGAPPYDPRRVRFTVSMGFLGPLGHYTQSRVLSTWESDSLYSNHVPLYLSQLTAGGSGAIYAITCGQDRLDFGGEPLVAETGTDSICGAARLRSN